MGGPFPPSFIDAVRDAADIVRVVSEYVPLKPAGARMKGLCPFHQEKTPSFSVDPRNQLFYCFGCQTGGDLFKFVMLYEKVPFGEAVELLAGRFGVPLPARSTRGSRTEDERARLLRLNRTAFEYYRTLLGHDAGRPAREYLERRGIEAETVDRLALGWAPDAWEGLLGHLRSKGFSEADVVRAGLALARRNGPGHYDRFRARLVFPIRDVQGRTVAFGGRTIGDAEPKYINSPETPSYTKGEHLYGLDLAREAIRREGYAVVVEGYLDLAALSQAGVEPVVASLGTAFTPAQARLLARYTRRVLVCYDGDSAGASATTRSLDLLLERSFEVRVVELPAGMDPDDFIRAHGAAAYRVLLEQAPAYLEFLVRREIRTRDLARLDQKVAAINAVLPHVAKLVSPVERAAWAGRLADALQIDDELVAQELRAALQSGRPRVRQRAGNERPVRWNEARLVALLLRSDEERSRFFDSKGQDEIDGARIVPIVQAILRIARQGGPLDYPKVLATLDDEHDRELLTRIAFRDEPEEGPNVEDCLCAFKRERLSRSEKEAIRQLGAMQASADSPPDHNDLDDRLLQVQRLARQRDALH